MGQKCPICKTVVPVDGFMPGETATCPECGTGLVVEPQYPSAASASGGTSAASRMAASAAKAGGARSAYGAPKVDAVPVVGSYSFKFGDKQNASEKIFDPAARPSPGARPVDMRSGAERKPDEPKPAPREVKPPADREVKQPVQPEVKPQVQRDVKPPVQRDVKQPTPKPAFFDFDEDMPSYAQPEPESAPSPAAPLKDLHVDPDRTIGFGDAGDFDFKKPEAARQAAAEPAKPAQSTNFFDQEPAQGAGPGEEGLGFDLADVLGSDLASDLGGGRPTEAWGGTDLQGGHPPTVPDGEDVWNTSETVPLSVDGFGPDTGDEVPSGFDDNLSAALDEEGPTVNADDLLSDDFDLKGGLMADLIYDVPPDEAAPLKPLSVDAPGKASRGRTAKGKKGGATHKAAPTGRGRRLSRFLIIPLVIGLIGAILGQTEYGYFGMNLITGGQRQTNGYFKTVNEQVVVVADSRESFIERIGALERKYRDKDSDENLAELVLTMNRYKERYPGAFAADQKMQQRLDQLKGLASGKDARTGNMTKVMDLVGQGKYTEARAMLDSMVASSAQDVDVLYYYGKIALATQKPAEAQKYFELALIKNPGLVSARYFLAQSFVDQGKDAEAKALLTEIMNKEVTHLPSRILAARIAIKESNFEEAARLAQHVIAAGTPGSDSDDIFEAHRIMAEVNLANGKRPERLASLKAALALKPADESTAVEAGKILLETGRRGEALDALTPCREHGCVTSEFLQVFAEAAYADDKVDVAKAAITQGESKYPESPRFGVIEGKYHLREGHLRTAEDVLDKAIKIDPKHVEAYGLMADALMAEDKLENAAGILEQGIAAAGPNAQLYVKLADIRVKRREFVDAETALRDAVKVDPNNDEAQLKLGMVVKDQGRNDEAASILNVLERRRALDFDGTVALADAYLEMQDAGRARDILQRLYADNPDNPAAGNAYGRALGAAKEYQKSIDVLQKMETRFPNNPQSPFLLGNVLMAQEKYADAVASYEQAIKLDGANQDYRLAAARAYLAQNTVDAETEARKHLDLVVTSYHSGSIRPEDQNPETYLMRGRILFAREKYLLAMKDFEAALALAPTRRDIMVEFGRSLFEQARFDDAAPYFKQVLEGDTLNPTANYYMGRIDMRDGKTEEATKHLVASVKRFPAMFPEAHRILGMIYKDKGLHAMARDSFKAFLKYTKDRKAAEALEVQRMLDKNSY